MYQLIDFIFYLIVFLCMCINYFVYDLHNNNNNNNNKTVETKITKLGTEIVHYDTSPIQWILGQRSRLG